MFTGPNSLHGDMKSEYNQMPSYFYWVLTTRNIPLTLYDKIKQELDDMEAEGLSQGYNNLHHGVLSWW